MLFASYKKKEIIIKAITITISLKSIFWMILFHFLPECIKIFYAEKGKAQKIWVAVVYNT